VLHEDLIEFKVILTMLLSRDAVRSDVESVTKFFDVMLTSFDLPKTREGLVKRKRRCRTPPVEILKGSWSNSWIDYSVVGFYDLGWCPTLNALLLKREVLSGSIRRSPEQSRKGAGVLTLKTLADFIVRQGDVMRVVWTDEEKRSPGYRKLYPDGA
jgi:hypothetical protein